MRLPEVWQRVTRSDDEAVSIIEIRVCFLARGAVAVVWLRRIRHVVLTVGSVVDRMRPGVIDLRGEAFAIAHGETRLQRVVI